MTDNAENNKSVRRTVGRPFQPGKSGNPGGRPKEVKEVIDLARSHTEDAIERLAFWLHSQDARASVQAAQVLLDRGWGKPKQEMDVNVGGTLLERLARGRARANSD